MATPPLEASSAGGAAEAAAPPHPQDNLLFLEEVPTGDAKAAVSATYPVGNILFSAWKYSTNTLSEMTKRIDLTPYHQHLNGFSTWGYRLASRVFKPYPYGSVTAIVDFMVSQGLATADSMREEVSGIEGEQLIQHPVYRRGCSKMCAVWIDQLPKWQELANKDIKSPYLEDQQLVSSLRQTISILRFSEDLSKVDQVLSAYVKKLISLPNAPYNVEKVMKATQISLSQLLLSHDLLIYQEFLFKLIREASHTLYTSDQAMRYLGNGLAEIGRTNMRMGKTRAKKLAAVYTALLEASVPSPGVIPLEGRSQKVPLLREILAGNQKAKATENNPLITLQIAIMDDFDTNQGRREEITIHATELGFELYPSEELLKLPIFDLCSPTRQTGTLLLFDVAFDEGIKTY